MAHLAIKARLAPTAREVADAKEPNEELTQHLRDGVISQECVHACYQMRHLSKNDAAIEGFAWLVVLGLLFTTIWLAGML
ncbi:MAG: hypothetical protein KGJ82_20930 [Nitrospirota bacterium]|nr:hypothetical protein [Nitrospirota bacterium]